MKKIIALSMLLISIIATANAQLRSGSYTFKYHSSMDMNGQQVNEPYAWDEIVIVALNMNIGFGLGQTVSFYQKSSTGVSGPTFHDFDFGGDFGDGLVYCNNNIYMGQSYITISNDLHTLILTMASDNGISRIYTR